MAVINAAQVKTVADPNAAYQSLAPIWERCKAICDGERFVKDLDSLVDVNNLLIPFSPSMSQAQYDFYLAEAELPGITAQFSKMIVGGLLRKPPTLRLPDTVPEEATEWINNQFGQDDSSLISFLDACLWEEVRSSRCWIFVDYPAVNNLDKLTKADVKKYKPYPVIWRAESVINWHISQGDTGKSFLDRVIVRGYVEDYSANEFHPDYLETVWVHEVVGGKYQVRIYQQEAPSTSVKVASGKQLINTQPITFTLKETIDNIQSNGKSLPFIPAWPLNGNIEPVSPVLTSIVDKEVNLYNKISRRNHLLYGAATYTPYITSDMSDDDFDDIVSSGLGSWFKLSQGDTAGVLGTPTDALQDMEAAIASSIEEMAKLGIRMLTPESNQSGIALQLRNASQTAQLGTLNVKASDTMRNVIAFMLSWKYNVEVPTKDIEFSLSADFNPFPIGADWLRLVTEWYENKLIPRSLWLLITKHNDLVPADYDDEQGQEEINGDELTVPLND